jgi:Ala-tRNA(Pro) deacylase
MTTTHDVPSVLLDVLERGDISYRLISHSRTQTAVGEAEALGMDPRAVAKTVVVEDEDGFARVVLPASERLDLHKVRTVLGSREVKLADETTLLGAYPEFELGAVPPLGGPRGDRVIFDSSLRRQPLVACDAGAHDQSLVLSTTDLVNLSGGAVADVCRR